MLLDVKDPYPSQRGSAHFAQRSDADTELIRCNRGRGRSAASRGMSDSGLITRCVVPPRHGVSSIGSAGPAALS